MNTNFLIQTLDGKVRHDFSFHLIEAIEYNNWFRDERAYDYWLSDYITEMDDYIPIGSVEFVQNYIEKFYGIKNVKPVNIPIKLMQDRFLKRKVRIKNKDIQNGEDIQLEGVKHFVKSNEKVKGFADVISDSSILPDGQYLISELVDIDSEWRAFVFNGELVGLKNYLGDFTWMPDVSLIEEMIDEYTDCPPAYTLDVGINHNGTFLIEVHNFWSTGLYGFNDSRILPIMFKRSFEYLIENGQ